MNTQIGQNIGESSIPQDVKSRVAQDVLSPQGKQELFNHLGGAMKEKPLLDGVLQALASKIGADYSSRIKNPDTAVSKIVQKRLLGRSYGVSDVNDALGARLIINDSKALQKAKEGISNLAKAGVFEILKSEPVKKDTYSAYHFDIKTPQGASAEIQLMNPKQELESLANHPLRAIYGEEPDHAVQRLKDKQSQLAHSVSNIQAKQISGPIKQLSFQQGPNPLNPAIVAQILGSTVKSS